MILMVFAGSHAALAVSVLCYVASAFAARVGLQV
jgi:hypothetical protein